ESDTSFPFRRRRHGRRGRQWILGLTAIHCCNQTSSDNDSDYQGRIHRICTRLNRRQAKKGNSHFQDNFKRAKMSTPGDTRNPRLTDALRRSWQLSYALEAMPDIVLTTLNAKYIHAAFGLRYLMANLGPLQSRARLLEFDINQRPIDIAEVLLAQHPRIVGIGVYIWNVTEATEVVALFKR